MKLFKITQKRTEGKCDAMRCPSPEITPGHKHPMVEYPVNLCERHVRELEEYNFKHRNDPSQTQTKTQTEDTQLSLDYEKESDNTSIVKTKHIGQLENILVANLAVQSGAVESREENAKILHSIAMEIKINDEESKQQVDQLLSIIHEDEKKLKKEIDAMYKPVKDAATNTRNTLKSWFGTTLEFYEESKIILKEKLGDFIRLEKAKADVLLAQGEHEKAKECLTEPTENVSVVRKYTYAIQNEGKNLPIELLVPDEAQNDEITKLLPRNLLRPNYDLINALVQEHGKLIEIPDVMVILEEDIRMKGKR